MPVPIEESDRSPIIFFVLVVSILSLSTILIFDFRIVTIMLYFMFFILLLKKGSSCSLSYVSWIYNYPCSQCLSPLKFRLRIPLIKKVYLIQYYVMQFVSTLQVSQWFSPGTVVSSIKLTAKI